VHGAALTLSAAIGILACLGWMHMRLMGALGLARVPLLPLGPVPGVRLPRLSVVIPALDEADTLEPALRSLLAQDYPDIEVVLVDDRSTDGTGALMDRIAAGDPRVRVVHVTRLPAGWLGKVNALRLGYGQTTGEYVLFTDADIHYAPGALRTALGLAMAERLDFLTLLPRLLHDGFFHGAFMQAAATSFVRFSGAWRGLADSPHPIGIGAFNLVRRAAFGATEGFTWFRMEVVDDVALGALMKRSGHRCGFAYAPSVIELLMYPSIAAGVRGLEKNLYSIIGRYSPLRTSLTVAAIVFIPFGPLLVFTVPGHPWLMLFPALALLSLLIEALTARLRLGWPLVPGLLAPLTDFLAAYALGMSAWACHRQGGIRWRGTLYPLAALRAGRRVSFP
jgi:hypothetical protein